MIRGVLASSIKTESTSSMIQMLKANERLSRIPVIFLTGMVETADEIKGLREFFYKNHNLFIVSNCQDGYIELVISKNGLEKEIKDFECFGHTGLQKDENIRLLMERNGLTDKDTVYIGDTLGDYTATKKAGLKFIFASYGFGEVETPDYVIKEFKDLLSVDEWCEA